jgi:hypothetical protein
MGMRRNGRAARFLIAPSESRGKACGACGEPAQGKFLMRAPTDPPVYVCRKCYAQWNEEPCSRCGGSGWYVSEPVMCRDGKMRKTRLKCGCGKGGGE